MSYFEVEALPGRPFFRCERLSASLQVSACVGMWTGANGPRGEPSERLFRCRGCPVGAAHAGAPAPSGHRLRGAPVCVRCHRADLRLISSLLCVGCYNRQREVVLGKNARGRPPAFHPPLERRRVAFVAGGVTGVLVRERSASSLELVVELLRDQGSRVVVGMGRGVVYGQG